MLPEIDGRECVEAVARKILTCLAFPYVFDDQALVLTASIGIAIYRADGRDLHELIREADSAMYLAKACANSPVSSH